MKKVLLVGDYEDADGGISVQMKSLLKMFRVDKGTKVELFSTRGPYILKPITFIRLIKKLRDYDIIHSHGCSYFGFTTSIMAYYAARIARKKLIITYHGGSADAFFKKYPWSLEYLRRANLVTVPSGFLQEIFAKYGIQTKVIPNYVNLSLFKPRTAKKKMAPIIITTRSLKRVYDLRCVIDAFPKVKADFPEAKLLIVGDGPQKKELQHLVDKHNLRDVVFYGRIANEEVAKLLHKSDIFVNCSLADNAPVSLIEAMACGLPIVTTNVGGIKYLVPFENAFLFFPQHSPEILYQQVKKIVNMSQIAVRKITLRNLDFVRGNDLGLIRLDWQKAYLTVSCFKTDVEG